MQVLCRIASFLYYNYFQIVRTKHQIKKLFFPPVFHNICE